MTTIDTSVGNLRPVEHDTIVIERVFHATPKQVFAAWADPAAKRQWFGCHEGWEQIEYRSDFRVGGSEINRARPPGEPEHIYDARYEDIIEDARIVVSYSMTLGINRISASLATIEFFPEEEKTRMVFTEQLAVLDSKYPAAGRLEGWQEILNTLARHLDESTRSDIRQRVINASRDRVYAMFSNPVHLANWWGPDGFSNTFSEFDLQKDGYWRFTMHGPDGKDYPNESRFLDVIPNERVVIEHLNGHHFILTITFTAAGNSTVVGWKQCFDTVEHYQAIAAFVADANEQNLSRLAAELKKSFH